MTAQYRLERILLNNPLDPTVSAALAELNSQFSKQDLFIEISSSEIILYLAKVNLSHLKLKVNELLKKNHKSAIFQELEETLNTIQKRITNIGSYGIKAGKRIFTNYASERKVQSRKSKQKIRGFHFYTAGHKFEDKELSIPKHLENQIICGDSEHILKTIPNNAVDLIFTSPPYNFGLEYEENSDSKKWEQYFDKLFSILSECIRILKFGGRLILNIQPLFSDYIPSHHIISNFLINQKMIWKGEILWDKHNYNCKYTSWGSYKSPSSPYLKYTWEFIEVFSKGSLKKKGSKEKIDITGEEFKDWVNAKWSIAPEKKMKSFDHPAMFPERLVERVLKLFSYQGDLILDPFNGVGTTTVVARKLDRRYIGIDISDKYCQIAKTRIRTSGKK